MCRIRPKQNTIVPAYKPTSGPDDFGLINNFGAGQVTLKGIKCPYWPSLCNSI